MDTGFWSPDQRGARAWPARRSIRLSSVLRRWSWFETSGRPRVEVARSLGISDNTLRNWVQADRDARSRVEDPDGLSESEREELSRLRRENAELRLDREILRKAAAFFARETTR